MLADGFSVSPSPVTMAGSVGTTLEKTVTVKDIANVPLNGVSFSYSQSDFRLNGKNIALSFSPSTFSMTANETRTVTITANVPADLLGNESTKSFGGGVTVTSGSYSQVFQLTINVNNVLSINEVDINSEGADDEVEPGEKFSVVVEVENKADDIDLEDCEVKVSIMDGDSVLEDNDGDKVEDEDEIDNLDDGDKEELTFDFTAPYDVKDGDEYDMEITVTCEAKRGGAVYTAADSSQTLNAKREDHKIDIFTASLQEPVLSCNRVTSLTVGVRDVGDDEEGVELTVRNSKLELDTNQLFELSNDPDDSNFDEQRSFTIDATDAAPGIYPIQVLANYDDGDLTETTQVTLEVKACENKKADDAPANGGDEEEEESDVDVVVQKTPQTSAGGVEAGETAASESDDRLLIGILVGLIVIIVIGFAIVIVKMLKR